MLVSVGPISSAPISNSVSPSVFALLALTPANSSLVLIEVQSIESISLALIQPQNSVNLQCYNGIAPWSPAPVDNTRRRQEAPVLQEIRQVAPELKQIRHSLPMLGG